MTIISEVDELHSRAIAAVHVQVGSGFLAASDFSKPLGVVCSYLQGCFGGRFLFFFFPPHFPCLKLLSNRAYSWARGRDKKEALTAAAKARVILFPPSVCVEGKTAGSLDCWRRKFVSCVSEAEFSHPPPPPGLLECTRSLAMFLPAA